MSTPRKHHYLPIFYLKNFVNEEGNFYQLDKIKKQIVKTTPKNAAHKKDLYTVNLEKLLVPFEQSIAKILSMREILREEAEALKNFLLLMVVRNLHTLNTVEAYYHDLLKKTFRFVWEVTSAERPKGLKFEDITFEINKDKKLDVFNVLPSLEAQYKNSIISLIYNPNFEASPFITADIPFIHNEAKLGQILMPLRKDLLIAITPSEVANIIVNKANDDFILNINTLLFIRSNRFCYSSHPKLLHGFL